MKGTLAGRRWRVPGSTSELAVVDDNTQLDGTMVKGAGLGGGDFRVGGSNQTQQEAPDVGPLSWQHSLPLGMNVANRERVKEACVIYSCMMNSACRWMHYMYRGRERKWPSETAVSQDDGLWITECGGQDEGEGCLFSFERPCSYSLPPYLSLFFFFFSGGRTGETVQMGKICSYMLRILSASAFLRVNSNIHTYTHTRSQCNQGLGERWCAR